MNKNIFSAAVVVFSLALAGLPADGFARGFGGFHGGGSFGGGGYHGGSFGGGGFDRGSYGGFDRGSYGGFDRSSYGSFDRGGNGNFDRGSYGGADRASYGNFDRSSYGSVDRGSYGGSVNRGELNGFLGLPTDGGFHAAGGVSAHAYEGAGGFDAAHVSAGARGAAVTPNGVAAGSRYSGATAVRGPEGNTYVHTSEAGRGVVAGPGGVAAGAYAGGRTAVNGVGIAGRGSAYGYGTRAWSPTYCHSWAATGRGWFGTTGVYGGAWCAVHPWAWYPAGWGAAAWNAAVWNTATWASVSGWIGAAPDYYAYNYGSDIVYQDGNVYYGGQPAGTAQQYYQEAANLADTAPAPAGDSPADNSQWLPLGVFGLMVEGQKTPDLVFQLAVDKQGAIRGNYFDQVTQKNLPVTGQVDKKDQRVAFTIGGASGGGANGGGIVVETGLYNLTQDQSTALVHSGAGTTQQELLVRVKQPQSQDEEASD